LDGTWANKDDDIAKKFADSLEERFKPFAQMKRLQLQKLFMMLPKFCLLIQKKLKTNLSN